MTRRIADSLVVALAMLALGIVLGAALAGPGMWVQF